MFAEFAIPLSLHDLALPLSLCTQELRTRLVRVPTAARVLSNWNDVADITDDWRALHVSHGRFPFSDPSVVEAWWWSRGQPAGETLHIVTLEQEGRLTAVAPLAVVRRQHTRFLRWAGSEMLDYGNTLSPDAETDALLWQHVRESGGYDVAQIKTVHADSRDDMALRSFAKEVRREIAYATSLQDPDQKFRSFGTNSTAKRKARRLAERGATFKVSTTVAPDHVIDALIRHKVAWSTERGEGGPFSDPSAAAAYFRAVTRAFSESGTLCLAWLETADDVLATFLCALHRDSLYIYMPSYDITLGNISPGQFLQAQLYKWAEEQGVTTIDFMRGGDAYKAEVANLRQQTCDYVFSGSLMGTALIPLLERYLFRRAAA